MDKEFVVEVVDGVSDRLDGEMAEIGAGNSSRTARDAGSKEKSWFDGRFLRGGEGNLWGIPAFKGEEGRKRTLAQQT